jgi:hypothetical protein
MAEERQEHSLKMKKMEAEMEQVFEMKVKEKKQKLKDSEADVSQHIITERFFHLFVCLDNDVVQIIAMMLVMMTRSSVLTVIR